MKNFLVTGAEGFIGSHLVEFLLKKNKNVKALILYNTENSWGNLEHLKKKKLKNLKVEFFDIRDFNRVLYLTKKIDIIINLAALISIPYSYSSPDSYFDTNIIGTKNILNSAIKNKVKRTILTSTSEIYGTAQYKPITEFHPINPQSPYAASKAAGDLIGLSYQKSFNIDLKIVRPFNCYGPRQSPRAIIPNIINQLLSGNILRLGNTNTFRDYTYINDTVNALYKISTLENYSGEVFNISNNKNYKILDIIKIIKRLMNINSKIIIQKSHERIRSKTSEVYNLIGDNVKAKKILKWNPSYHGLKGFEQGLLETIEWNKKNFSSFKSNSIYFK